MKLAELSGEELGERLAGHGLDLRLGPFALRLRSPLASVRSGLALLYADYPLIAPGGFADFHVRIAPPRGLRGVWRPQALFSFDGFQPFTPLPLDQAFAFLEWGLNWCVANYIHRWLVVHAAVLERDGRAVLLPGPPGAGKSTLTAALCLRGWRLLSDELAIVSPEDLALTPLPRPVSLKNRSIDVIRAFDPAAVIGPPAHDTAKGTVAHMRPPADSVARAAETARPTWIVFPRWEADAPAAFEARPRAHSGLELGRNAFNYSVLGRLGFDTLAALLDTCGCFDFRYGRLDEAIVAFDRLASAR